MTPAGIVAGRARPAQVAKTRHGPLGGSPESSSIHLPLVPVYIRKPRGPKEKARSGITKSRRMEVIGAMNVNAPRERTRPVVHLAPHRASGLRHRV